MKHSLSVTLEQVLCFTRACVFSHVRLFVFPHGYMHQAPLPWNFPARILVEFAFPSSEDLPQRSNCAHLLCLPWIGRQIVYHCHLFHPLYLVYFLQNPVRWVIRLLLFREDISPHRVEYHLARQGRAASIQSRPWPDVNDCPVRL